MNITKEIQHEVVGALIERKKIWLRTEKSFATSWKIHPSVWSTLKTQHASADPSYVGQLPDSQWIELARALDVLTTRKKWNVVRTEVFEAIEEEMKFCKNNAKARILVDDCGIGKSQTAKVIAARWPETYYVDCSQCKSYGEFIRAFALAVGYPHKGNLNNVLGGIKFTLNGSDKPLVIIDEAGDLNDRAFLELKALWNATEGACGWYMMGANGLRAKIDRGFNNDRLGYAEIFSRYSEKFSSVVPLGKEDKKQYYARLIRAVLIANTTPEQRDKINIDKIVKQCLINDAQGRLGGLRRAESLLILNLEEANKPVFTKPNTQPNGQSVNA